MIDYKSSTPSEAFLEASKDSKWSAKERKALAVIADYVSQKERNAATMATEEWLSKPVLLPDPKTEAPVFQGKWTNGERMYTVFHQKYMVVGGREGYRIGKCYPEPEEV